MVPLSGLILYNSAYFLFLLKKYENRVDSVDHQALISRFRSSEPIICSEQVISFFSLLTERSEHFFFRRFSGAGERVGLLDAFHNRAIDLTLMSIESYLGNPDLDLDFIIAPLTMQEVPELYRCAHGRGIPVVPLTFNTWESKITQRLVFKQLGLDLFIVPSIYIPSLRSMSSEDHHQVGTWLETVFKPISTHIFVKEDVGFHSGAAVPYYFGPVDQFENLLKNYLNQDISLIVEPLVWDSGEQGHVTRIFKTHAFGSLVEGEVLVYDVQWLKNTGKFDNKAIKIIQQSSLATYPPGFPVEEINRFVKEFMPLNMMSLDFVYCSAEDTYWCIDINHSCGSWGEVQETDQVLENTIFDVLIQNLVGQPKDRLIQTYYDLKAKTMPSKKVLTLIRG